MNTKHKFIYAPLEISYETVNHGWNMPFAHEHNDHEIYILLSGARTVWNGSQKYESKASDAVFFAPGIPHKSAGDNGYSGICIHFSYTFLKQHFSEKTIATLLECFDRPILRLSNETIEKLKKYSDTFTTDNPANFVILADILMSCNHDLITNTAVEELCTTSGDIQHMVLSYIEENFATITQVSDIAAKYGITEGYVYKLVKKHTGYTPKQYINELRMKSALRDLCVEKGTTIKKIATKCGYSSYEYFCRLFKAKYGISPSEYQNKYRI